MVETVNFEGDQLVVVRDENRDPWVAVRPICASIGIQFGRQMDRLQGDPKFSCAHMYTTGADGKTYEMFCLLRNMLGRGVRLVAE